MNPSQSIETVLTSLQTTQPPAGLESRVLARLKLRAAEQPHRQRAVPFAFATAALLLVAATTLFVINHHAAYRPATSSQAQAPVPANPPLAAGRPFPTLARVNPPRPTRLTQPPISMDELALEEMRAPSRPAPPLPLTEQERLLLQAIRNGETQELAELNTDVLHALEARDKADFDRFFHRAAPTASAPIPANPTPSDTQDQPASTPMGDQP